MPSEVEVYLSAPHYVLGDIELDHTDIRNLSELAAGFRMPENAKLWGWGSVRRNGRSFADMAIDSGRATLERAGVAPSSVDALVFCSTRVPGDSNGHGELLRTMLQGIELGDIPYYGQTLNRCINLMAAIDQAVALVARGRHRRILVATTDEVGDGQEMANYALFSDAAASCLISAERPARDGYLVLGCDSAQRTASLDWTNEISSDLSRQLNDRLLTPRGLKLGDVAGLMHLNMFIPLAAMKERQAGFSAEQIFLDNIPKYGHCFAADPLINLVDRDALGHVRPDGIYMLAASVPGSRAGVLLQRLTDSAEGEGR